MPLWTCAVFLMSCCLGLYVVLRFGGVSAVCVVFLVCGWACCGLAVLFVFRWVFCLAC